MRRLLPKSLFAQGCLLFLLAFSLRMFYLFGLQKFEVHAHVEVERAAMSLAGRGEMADPFGPGTGPTAHVPPLYTLYLAGIYKMFGIASHEAVVVQRVTSALLASLAIALLPLLTRRARLSPGVGILASLLMALSPCYFFVECYGRQENVWSVLLAMLLLQSWLRLRDTRWQGRRDVWVFAFLTGLACLLAPQLLAFVGLGMMLDWLVQGGNRWRIVKAGVVMAGVSAVMIAPWAWRNHHALGGFVPLRSNFGLELHIGNNPVADGWTFAGSTTDHASPSWPHPYSHPGEKARLKQVGELVYMREKSQQSKQWISDHPGEFTRLTLRRTWLFWFTPRSIWSSALSGIPVRVAYTAGITLLAFLGLATLFVQRHPNRWPLLLALVAPSLIYLVTHVNPRYRYSNIWATALLASQAVVWGAGFVRPRRGHEFTDPGQTLLERYEAMAGFTRACSSFAKPPRPASAPAAGSHPVPCEPAPLNSPDREGPG